MRRTLLFICLPLLFSPLASPAMADAGDYLWLSDIHIDPFYPYTYKDTRSQSTVEAMLEKMVDRSDPAQPAWKPAKAWPAIFDASPNQASDFSVPGADSNHKLLQDLLDRAQAVSASPDFMLITGDFLGHGFGYNYSVLAPRDMQSPAHYQSFVHETLRYVAQSIHARYSDLRIYATLGNNDAYCGDYDLHLDRPGSSFLKDTVDLIFEDFLTDLSATEQADIRSTFLKGGYFAVSLPAPSKNKIFVLNSIPFMAKYPDDFRSDSFPPTEKVCAASTPVDASAEIGWLEQQVKDPGWNRAWIAAHVPPGIDCYGGDATWTDTYLDPYRQLFTTATSNQKLAATLVAHTHMAEFKLLKDGTDTASIVLLGPSVSPIHKNNPSFRIVSYDRSSLDISDYETHYVDIEQGDDYGHWQSFTFTGSYPHLNGVDAASLTKLYGQLTTDKAVLKQYAYNYSTRAPIDPTNLLKNYQTCIGSLTGQ